MMAQSAHIRCLGLGVDENNLRVSKKKKCEQMMAQSPKTDL